MAKPSRDAVLEALLERHGRTYCDELGIDIEKGTPSPLFRWLCASLLFSARISAEIAVSAAGALADAGWTTPQKMADATWKQRVKVINESGYARYDERTSTMLGEVAEKLLDEYGGDLRRIRDGDVHKEMQQFKGIGPTGATIFCREVQGVWPELAPYVDRVAAKGAERLQLPTSADRLAGLVGKKDLPRLVAGCVRAARDNSVVDDVLGRENR